MHITELSLECLDVPFREPIVTSGGTWQRRRLGLLRLRSNEGFEGLGEVASERPGGDCGTEASLAGQLNGLELQDEAAVDERLARLDGGSEATRALRSAAESAVLDLLARRAGRSIAGWLAEQSAATVRVNAFMGIDAPRRVAESATRWAEAGFSCLKLKAADEPIADVVQRVAAVREAVGPELGVRIDFNGALRPDDGARMLDALAPFDLDYVEQPIPVALGTEALARLRLGSPIAIAADESVADEASAHALLAARAVDVLVLKPARVGGLRSAARIATLAAGAGVRTVVSTLFESGIGVAGALQLAATLDDGEAHGLATLDLLADDVLMGAPAIAHGRMQVPSGPGLGVDLDPGAIERLRVR